MEKVVNNTRKPNSKNVKNTVKKSVVDNKKIKKQNKKIGFIDFIRESLYSEKNFDYALFFVVLFLVGFGLVMIYSTSSYTAYLKSGSLGGYFNKQAIFSILGIIAMLIVSKIDYHIFQKKFILIFMYSFTFILLISVLLFGSEINGKKRWLNLGGISLQPSEVAKLVIILVIAGYVSMKLANKIDKIKALVIIGIMSIFLIGPVLLQNLSTAIVLFMIVFSIIFVTSKKYLRFILGIGLAGIAGVIFIFAGEEFRAGRVDAWLNPETSAYGYQTKQSLYAIGSGGLFGKGLGQSIQKLGYLPEAHNDMIFSIICEELGAFGGICVILLFIMLIWRCMIIVINSKDLYGSLIVVGVIAHIGTQVIINIGAVTNTIPPTGVPLPFISYGGTSVVFLLIEMGIVLSVSRQMQT